MCCILILLLFSSSFFKDTTTTEEPETKQGSLRPSWSNRTLHLGVDIDETPFFILGTHKDDESCLPHVLTPPLMEALHKHLPMGCADCNFWLKYSLVRDGASIQTLEAKAGLSKDTFMVIETLNGHVFGCFMTKVRF